MIKNSVLIFIVFIIFQACDNKQNKPLSLGQILESSEINCEDKNIQYICLHKSNSEYGNFLWKDQKRGVVYRRECKIPDSDFQSYLRIRGLDITSSETIVFENSLTSDYFEFFGFQEFYTQFNADTLICGVKGKHAWTFNWEIEDYENLVVDSIFSLSYPTLIDSLSVICDSNTLILNNWVLGKDKFEKFPSRLKSNWRQDSDYLSDSLGVVHGFRTRIDWNEARYFQKQLENSLGKAKVVVNHKLFPTTYVWEWNNGIIVLILDKSNFKEPLGRILVHSGEIHQDDFLLYF